MVRQTLDADSAYADVALHGNGLLSLQYREEKGAATHEIQANVSAAKRLRIVKRGAASVENRPSDMPAFENVFSDDEISAVLAYIRSTW